MWFYMKKDLLLISRHKLACPKSGSEISMFKIFSGLKLPTAQASTKKAVRQIFFFNIINEVPQLVFFLFIWIIFSHDWVLIVTSLYITKHKTIFSDSLNVFNELIEVSVYVSCTNAWMLTYIFVSGFTKCVESRCYRVFTSKLKSKSATIGQQ